jgi:S-formylglutathione hydrolase FrmB
MLRESRPIPGRKTLALLAACLLAGCGEAEPPPGLKVESYTVHSRAVHKDMAVKVIVPEGERRPPLLVFLHGRDGDESSYVRDPLLHAIDALGDRAPIVALPDGDEDKYWHDRASGAWGRYVVREVIPQVARQFGADRRRVAIGGISMGGFGAFDLALQHPGRFCAVGGHSPAIWTSASETAPGAFDDAADFARNDVVALARARGSGLTRGGGHARRAWIDSGDADPFVAGDRALAAALGVPKRTWPGAHDAAYWRAHYRDYLRFYAAAVERC